MSTTKRRQQLQLLRDEALDAYLNREDFHYDVNADALYRQYRDRYLDLGRTAMQDTLGQTSALTGGYANSYAQNVGQQAYQNYMEKLADVVPELYQLAYDRYQDQGDRLYQAYESYARQEQDLLQELQWEAKQREEQRQFDLSRSDSSKKEEGAGTGNAVPLFDNYYTWLQYHQKKGERQDPNNPVVTIKYDNGNVSTGNVMIMQRVLGVPDTGMWNTPARRASGGMTADEAWVAYTKGQLQQRSSHGMGDRNLSNSNVRAMERALGVREDGYWSKEDQQTAGGMTEAQAWEAYRSGRLQNWRSLSRERLVPDSKKK